MSPQDLKLHTVTREGRGLYKSILMAGAPPVHAEDVPEALEAVAAGKKVQLTFPDGFILIQRLLDGRILTEQMRIVGMIFGSIDELREDLTGRVGVSVTTDLQAKTN